MRIGNREKLYIYQRDNKRCFYCKKKLRYEQMTIDHFYPKSRGGKDEIFNLVTCCKKCNKIKKDNIIEDYENIIIELFKKAVQAGFIKDGSFKSEKFNIMDELIKVDRLELINDEFVFQNSNIRFYIKDGRVIKVIFI